MGSTRTTELPWLSFMISITYSQAAGEQANVSALAVSITYSHTMPGEQASSSNDCASLRTLVHLCGRYSYSFAQAPSCQ
jgi:hypothetical protein